MDKPPTQKITSLTVRHFLEDLVNNLMEVENKEEGKTK